eukprot:Gb_00477 [translate_table: standard]
MVTPRMTRSLGWKGIGRHDVGRGRVCKATTWQQSRAAEWVMATKAKKNKNRGKGEQMMWRTEAIERDCYGRFPVVGNNYDRLATVENNGQWWKTATIVDNGGKQWVAKESLEMEDDKSKWKDVDEEQDEEPNEQPKEEEKYDLPMEELEVNKKSEDEKYNIEENKVEKAPGTQEYDNLLVKDRQEEKEAQQEEITEDQTYKPMEDDQEDGHVQVRTSKTNNVEEEEAKIQVVAEVLEISRAKLNIDEHCQHKSNEVAESMQQTNRDGIPPNKEDIEYIEVFEESPSFGPLSKVDSITVMTTIGLAKIKDLFQRDGRGEFEMGCQLHFKLLYDVKAKQGEMKILPNFANSRYKDDVSYDVLREILMFPYGEIKLEDKVRDNTLALSINGFVVGNFMNGQYMTEYKEGSLNLKNMYKNVEGIGTYLLNIPFENFIDCMNLYSRKAINCTIWT